MANFILWGATTDEDDETTLSWFAAAAHDVGIKDGTREMVVAMLEDLGYQASAVASWRVRHIRTNYVDAKTWGHAWEIAAKLPSRFAELPLQGNLVRSAAEDATWNGAFPAPPSECVLFVDFRDSDVAERAERILRNAVGRELDMTLSHRGCETAQLVASFGVRDESFFARGAPEAAKAAAVFHELGATTSRS